MKDENGSPTFRVVGGTAFRSESDEKDPKIERIDVSIRNSLGQEIFRQEDVFDWGYLDLFAKDIGDKPESTDAGEDGGNSFPKIPVTMLFMDKKQGNKVVRTTVVRGADHMVIIEHLIAPEE